MENIIWKCVGFTFLQQLIIIAVVSSPPVIIIFQNFSSIWIQKRPHGLFWGYHLQKRCLASQSLFLFYLQ